jgi:hypothetical protein
MGGFTTSAQAIFEEKQLIALKESETYQTILKIEDWDVYFAEMKTKLQRELESLLENKE